MKINQTKIIQTIQKEGSLNFNNGDEVIKLEDNCYLIKSSSYTETESGIDYYTLKQLRGFLKEHSTLFNDIFDSCTYKKENYQKYKNTPNFEIENYQTTEKTFLTKLLDTIKNNNTNILAKLDKIKEAE